MDILEIDVASFAGRAGYVAATQLHVLLTDGPGAAPVLNWYDAAAPELRGGADVDAAAIDTAVEAMATYVMTRRCAGETLYRHANSAGDWAAEPLARRLAFDLFAQTVDTVGGRLLELQKAAEEALEIATRPAPKPPAIEDTIFETEEKLGTLRPEAVAAAGQIAAHDAAVTAEREEQERLAAEQQAEEAQQPETAAAPPAPLSVGETPPASPVNKGGRGRKKPR